MLWEQSIEFASISDIGFRRQNNQDSCVVQLSSEQPQWRERGHVFVVADGMGGHAVGELASKIAVDTIPLAFQKSPELPPAEALRKAIEQANENIHQRGVANHDFQRMGTTCTTLALGPYGALIGHVGDSRCYRIRSRTIDQLTADHSLVWELIQQRKVSVKDAETLVPRNVITRSLGPEPVVRVDVEGPHPVLPGDIYLLCSDGLTGLMTDSEIGMVAAELPPSEACRMLVHVANLRGGLDNITVIIARVGGIPAGWEPEPTITEANGISWVTLLLGTLLSMLVISAGILTLIPGHRGWGVGLGGLAAVLGVLWAGWSLGRTRRIQNDRDPLSTVIWRPYRTAGARLSGEFLERLAKMEAELLRVATDDHWDLAWEECQQCSQRARTALKERKFGKSLRDFSRSFDLLMQGVQQQRKQLFKENRLSKSDGSIPVGRSTPSKEIPASAGDRPPATGPNANGASNRAPSPANGAETPAAPKSDPSTSAKTARMARTTPPAERPPTDNH